MGVTIHFEGQLLSNVVYDDLIATITAIAERQNWLTAVIESAEVTLLRVCDEKDWITRDQSRARSPLGGFGLTEINSALLS